MQLAVLVCVVGFFASFAHAADRLSQTTLIETQFDTNLVNSPNDNEPLSSPLVSANHSLRFNLLESRTLMTEGLASVSASLPSEYTDMTQVKARFGARQYWQPSTGYRAPWYVLETAATGQWHNFEQHQWIGLNSKLKREQRLNDRLFLSAGLSGEYRLANESAFEGARGALTFYEDWRATKTFSVYAQQQVGYGRMTTSYHGALESRGHHIEGENDDDHNDDSTPDSVSDEYFMDEGLSRMLGEDWYTYGVDGWFAEALMGINVPVLSRASIDIAYRFHLESTEDVSYHRQTFFISLFAPW